jgi:hypothetical protein
MSFFAGAKSAILILLVSAFTVSAQSQAVDAQIEGVVVDINGAAIPAVTIIAANIETGGRRSAASRENGGFRIPLLPLGQYSIILEHPGFKRFERQGIILSAGQTAVIEVILETGTLQETVTVTADAAIADLSKNEIGRLVNVREVKNLPLIKSTAHFAQPL